MNKLKSLLRLARPGHWIKNLVVFIPLVFSGEMLVADKFFLVVKTALIFCLMSSAVYIVNDIMDCKADKLHPEKKHRPIASGEISVHTAAALAVLLSLLSTALSIVWVKSEYLTLFVVVYCIVMFLYSLLLKHIPIVDAITVALGFVIKAVAGSVVIQVSLASFLVVTIISTALLISFGKRMAEVASMGMKKSVKHRAALADYTPELLSTMISALTASAFVSYALFAYNTSYIGLSVYLSDVLPPMYKYPQWLMLTIPLVFYCLARYLVVVYNKNKEVGTPESLVFRDLGLFMSIALWGILVIGIIYLPEIVNGSWSL
ncbi:MAG: UbiA family prenyltransferase [Patescibacteria group bacterium]|nr:UbiA family prenyltransferase [Patescibacteria group bacterium]